MYNPIFKTAPVGKKIWRIINTITSIWHKNMLGYLSLDIICPSKLTGFLKLHFRKTARLSEQIFLADKYLSIFLAKWRLLFMYCDVLENRGHASFGQHQESQPLGWFNTGSPRFTDFPSNLDKCDWLTIQIEYSAHAQKICLGRRSLFLVLT